MPQPTRVYRNVLYNFLSQVWFVALPLVTSPYVVRRLGLDAYGVLSLATAVIGYLAVLDLGMGAATVKYIADYHVQRDFKAISKVVGTSITIYSGLGLLGTICILGSAKWLVTRLLHVPANFESATLLVFYIGSLGFLANMPLTVFNAIPNALQRFDILVGQNLIFGTVTVLGQVVLLSLGYSLVGLVTWNVIVSTVGILVFVIVSKRLLPGVSFRPTFDRPTAKKILRFSALKFFSVVSGQIVFQLDKILLAIYLPIATLSYYVVSLNLAQRMLSIVPNITTAVFPAVSEFQAHTERLHAFYVRAAKAVLVLILPLAVALIVLADRILTLWMGPEFATNGATTLQYLSLGFLLASFSAVPCVFVEALGKPELPALFAVISAVLNLGFALLLIPRWGIAGPALALIINSVLQVPLFVDRATRKILGLSTMEVVRKGYARPLVAASVLFLFYTLTASLATSLQRLGALIVVGTAFYALLCYGIGVADPDEKLKLKQYWMTMTRGGRTDAG